VNWDPVEHTVLANEQVVDGCGWRSGAPVERRQLSQWFLKISHYADDLLQGIEELERWPERVRLMQNNWIGRSKGASVQFSLTLTQHYNCEILIYIKLRFSQPGQTLCMEPLFWQYRHNIRLLL
jgi:leucyl-tRNA synthetase